MQIIDRKTAISLGLNSYFTGKPCVNGHIAERRIYDWKCRQCERNRYKDWRSKNPDYDKQRYKNNPEIRSKKIKLASHYYENNKEKVNHRKSIYHKNTIDKFREHRRNYFIDWRSRPSSKTIVFMRSCIKRMTNYKKPRSTEKILGYTRSDLINHIESKFKDGMTWENYGEWHIDHVKPIYEFIKENENRPEIINSLNNLQPLWASENMSKGKKYE